MLFQAKTLIGIEDLSFDKQEEIRNAIAEFIKEDKEVMKQIRQEATNEWLDSGASYKKKMTVNDLIDLRVEEIAMKNEGKFRQYLAVEMDVEL